MGPVEGNNRWNRWIPTEERRKTNPTPLETRDVLNRKILESLKLAPEDRADLEKRGFSEDQITRFGARSVEQWQPLPFKLPDGFPGIGKSGLANAAEGYLCPVHSFDGKLLAFQVRTQDANNKYRWLSSKNGASNLPSGEQPLAFNWPEGTETPKYVALVEGTGPKPFLTCERTGALTIGAAGGLWASSPGQLTEAVQRVQEMFPGLPWRFLPDAGAAENEDIRREIRKTTELLQGLGVEPEALWWGQLAKGPNDPDEVAPEVLASAKVIPVEEFLNFGNEVRAEFLEGLAQLQPPPPPEGVDLMASLPMHRADIEAICQYFKQDPLAGKQLFRSAVASLIPRDFQVKIGNHAGLPIWWVGLINEPGRAKSGFENEFFGPLQRMHNQEADEYVQRLKHYKKEVSQSGKKGNEDRDEPELKPRRRYRLNNFTMAKLGRISIEQSGAGLLINPPELSGFLKNLARADKDGSSDLSTALALRDGGNIDKEIVGSDGIDQGLVGPRTSFSLAGTIQPGVLERLMGQLPEENGFWTRFIWLNLNPKAPLPRASESFDGGFHRFEVLYDRLSSWAGSSPVNLRLSPEALDEWRLWEEWTQQELNKCDHKPKRYEVLSKFRQRALEISLIDYLAGVATEGRIPSNQDEIPGFYMRCAIAEVKVLIEETLSVLGKSGDESVSAASKIFDKLTERYGVGAEISWTKARECFPQVKDFKTGKWKKPSMADHQETIDEMIEAGAWTFDKKRSKFKLMATQPTRPTPSVSVPGEVELTEGESVEALIDEKDWVNGYKIHSGPYLVDYDPFSYFHLEKNGEITAHWLRDTRKCQK